MIENNDQINSFFERDKRHTSKQALSFKYWEKDPINGIFILINCIDQITEIKSNCVSDRQYSVLFEGTDFSNTRERGASLGAFIGQPGWCENVPTENCKCFPEYELTNSQADQVWIDNVTKKPKILVEVMSGIHLGSYLDKDHESRACYTYFTDDVLYGKIEYLVIVAGGFYQKSLNSLSNWQKDHPTVELILLKTIHVHDENGTTIGLERVRL